MKIDGVINLDEVYDLDPDEFWYGGYPWNDPSMDMLNAFRGYTLQVTMPTPIPESLRRVLFGAPPCTYNQPPLLPRPEWHVETVTVSPFARFGYMKQKVRRMARERFNRARS